MLIRETDDVARIDWDKMNGLVPAIVQHAFDGRVLMQGWMNRQALEHTLECGRVTFWSRSRKALWTKGETSGNVLELGAVYSDCDDDSLLVTATPAGPTCHRGCDSCFDDENPTSPGLAFLAELERVIAQRQEELPEGSYTTRLFEAGVKRIAQKVGEEGVETALAAVAADNEELVNESADLLYHLLVLLRACDLNLSDITTTLERRHG